MSKVIKITNLEEYRTFKNSHPNGVIFYSSEKCHACKKIEPLYTRIANRYHKRIAMAYTDIDDCGLNFKELPMFVSFYEGKQLDSITGANPDDLKHLIKANIKTGH